MVYPEFVAWQKPYTDYRMSVSKQLLEIVQLPDHKVLGMTFKQYNLSRPAGKTSHIPLAMAYETSRFNAAFTKDLK